VSETVDSEKKQQLIAKLKKAKEEALASCKTGKMTKKE